jgi:hypothetical protein
MSVTSITGLVFPTVVGSRCAHKAGEAHQHKVSGESIIDRCDKAMQDGVDAWGVPTCIFLVWKIIFDCVAELSQVRVLPSRHNGMSYNPWTLQDGSTHFDFLKQVFEAQFGTVTAQGQEKLVVTVDNNTAVINVADNVCFLPAIIVRDTTAMHAAPLAMSPLEHHGPIMFDCSASSQQRTAPSSCAPRQHCPAQMLYPSRHDHRSSAVKSSRFCIHASSVSSYYVAVAQDS